MRFAIWSLLFTACSGGGGDADETDADTDTDSDTDTDTDPPNRDSDGDGLSDDDERNIYGTDPKNADTDGDGYGDGDEIADGTSPTNEYSHRYMGDYNVGACPAYPDEAAAHPTGSRVVATGGGGKTTVPLYLPGDTVQNFQLIDQYGEMVDLYSFCGKFVDLVFFQFDHLTVTEYSALTCWIQDMKEVHQYYRDYGYELVVVVTAGVGGDDLPTTDDVAAVAALVGFDNPVLASADESISSFHWWFDMDFHDPTLVHIGPELQVLSVDDDDCAGTDRDPCPHMGSAVPKGQCWPAGPDDECEALDYTPDLNCACPAPACEDYCGKCPIAY